MTVDIKRNINFYRNFDKNNDLWCDCVYCKFYRSKIGKIYPEISKYLEKLAIDINKPYESSLPFLSEDNKLSYDFAWYICFGDEDGLNNIEIDGANIRKTLDYPDPGLDSQYFILEIGPLYLGDKSDYANLG
uniref:hypothetical protein n=1 Tax=Anaerococcus mediterraneensis TaxID=1870984 RepID=UPI000930EC75|nr:hypothetical protein [Anaerococcus mediterraneensis]